MPQPSKVVLKIKRSGIREVMDLATKQRDVIHLEVGEPLFVTPAHITEAALGAARAGFTKYTPNAGLLSLRQVVAGRLNHDYALQLTPEKVVITVGAIGALASAVRAVIDAGDEVLIPDPGWPNYEMVVTCAGAVPRHYKMAADRGFLPSIESLDSLVSPKTKAIIINTPSNPLGVVFPEKLVAELVEFARRRDLFLISDEVYEKIIFTGRHYSALSFDSDERVIGVFSCSKTYAMTGWRVGYAIAGEAVAAQIAKLQEVYVSSASSISQKAAEAAILGEQACVEKMKQAYQKNLYIAREILDSNSIKYQLPQGAFYLWLDAGCSDSFAFARKLLLEKKVAVAPGSTFGVSAQQYIRLSLASSPEDVRQGVHRLVSFLAEE